RTATAKGVGLGVAPRLIRRNIEGDRGVLVRISEGCKTRARKGLLTGLKIGNEVLVVDIETKIGEQFGAGYIRYADVKISRNVLSVLEHVDTIFHAHERSIKQRFVVANLKPR